MRCPTCGVSLPDGARFCPSCGATLGPRTDERRIVTVVFADVVGFTALAERRDPEQVKNLLDRCFDGLAEIVTSFGGRVDRIVGDALIALFGAPVAHEDDAERAVRAALRMQEALEAYRSGEDSGLEMRIGVNTGEVLVGALRAGADYTAMGDVVNTASRLEASANAGTVLVGEATYAATKDAIRYEHSGAVFTKGREQPVETWVAQEPLGPPGTRRMRARTPLVGREAELGMLEHALRTATVHRRPHIVLLAGEAGVGKTRLVEEGLRSAQDEHGAFVLQGRCLPYGEASLWWPIAEALRGVCGIETTDGADVATERCRGAISKIVDDPEEAIRVSDGLLYLMGYEGSLADVEPSRARAAAARALRLCIEGIGEKCPVVLALSELHWADDLLLELLDTVFERLHTHPVILLATARPDLAQRWHPRPGRQNVLMLHLDPLSPDAADRLLTHLLTEEIPADVRRALIERSGGNPLFLEELAGLLADQRAETQHPVQRGEIGHLPATLRGLVAARLDALSPEERALLEDAAVIGRSGSLETLDALAGSREMQQEPAVLVDALVTKDLLEMLDDEYTFKSDLVRDVAYETLTKGERARRHAALAEWLEGRAREAGREDESLERIAYHYGAAAELVDDVGTVDGVPPEIRKRALDWLGRAAARAEERETAAVSVHLFDQALRLAGSEPTAERRALLLGRAKARVVLRDLRGAREDVERVREETEASGDHGVYGRALIVEGDIAFWEGNYEESSTVLERAASVCRDLGDDQGEAEALRLWGMASLFRSEIDAAERAIARALEAFTRIGDRRGEAWCMQNLAWTAFMRGEYELAEERLNRSSETFVELGDIGGMGWALGLLGYVAYLKGELDTAETIASELLPHTIEMGDRWAHGMMLNLLASVRLWQGRAAEALEGAVEARGLFRQLEDAFGEFQATVTLAGAAVAHGRIHEAVEVTQDWLTRESTLPPRMLGEPQQLAAEIAWRSGNGRASATAPHGMPSVEVHHACTYALNLLQAGGPADAIAVLEGVDPSEVAAGARARLRSVRALAYSCGARPDDAVAEALQATEGQAGTYLDRMLAYVALGLAEAQRGDRAEARNALDKALEVVDVTEDQVDRAIARLARAQALAGSGGAEGNGETQVARERLEQLGVNPDGWETLFSFALGERRATSRSR